MSATPSIDRRDAKVKERGGYQSVILVNHETMYDCIRQTTENTCGDGSQNYSAEELKTKNTISITGLGDMTLAKMLIRWKGDAQKA